MDGVKQRRVDKQQPFIPIKGAPHPTTMTHQVRPHPKVTPAHRPIVPAAPRPRRAPERRRRHQQRRAGVQPPTHAAAAVRLHKRAVVVLVVGGGGAVGPRGGCGLPREGGGGLEGGLGGGEVGVAGGGGPAAAAVVPLLRLHCMCGGLASRRRDRLQLCVLRAPQGIRISLLVRAAGHRRLARAAAAACCRRSLRVGAHAGDAVCLRCGCCSDCVRTNDGFVQPSFVCKQGARQQTARKDS